MSRKSKPPADPIDTEISDKFRTTPIKSTITKITGLPRSAILYKCEASSYWQFRVFLVGKARKRSTKEEDLDKAKRAAALIYAELLKAVHGEEVRREPSSRKTLQTVADSLWAKTKTRIKNGEVNKDKLAKDTYIFERHIKPFFNRYDVKDIDAESIEEFKSYLAEKELSPATQASYIQLVMSFLKEAQIKRYITHLPPKPRIRVEDEARGYFTGEELSVIQRHVRKAKFGLVHEFKTKEGEVYRKTRITEELYFLIEFMLNTYIRPTDIAVLRHRHVHIVRRHKIDFIELRHPSTKRHRNHMLGTELALSRYQEVKKYQQKFGKAGPDDYLFLPETLNRETALENLSTQFTAILEMTGLRTDSEGKPRALYSLRHTAIVNSIRKGLPLEMIASNARTSSDMIRRFYGSHIKSALYMGSAFIDAERSIRTRRYDMVNQLARDIGLNSYDAYEEEDKDRDEEGK